MIPDSIYYTKEADAYHMHRCVSKTMSKMAHPEHCIEYMAGVLAANPDMANITIADVRASCANKESNFTVAQAEKLCEGIIGAHRSFWSDYEKN